MNYDVFISSKSEDYPFAGVVYDFLEANGVHCFLASRELDKIGEAQYANTIKPPEKANLSICAYSIEPKAELPVSMRNDYNFEEV